jgi:excisionase family DNA binding protein
LAKELAIVSDEILTVAELAHLLKVADKTVYTMAQNAELPCFKVRGQWRFRHRDIDAWIEANLAQRGAPIASSSSQSRSRNRGRR